MNRFCWLLCAVVAGAILSGSVDQAVADPPLILARLQIQFRR